MKDTLARVSSGGKGGSVAVTGRRGVALESLGEAGWTAARRAWAQGGRRGAGEARRAWVRGGGGATWRLLGLGHGGMQTEDAVVRLSNPPKHDKRKRGKES